MTTLVPSKFSVYLICGTCHIHRREINLITPEEAKLAGVIPSVQLCADHYLPDSVAVVGAKVTDTGLEPIHSHTYIPREWFYMFFPASMSMHDDFVIVAEDQLLEIAAATYQLKNVFGGE